MRRVLFVTALILVASCGGSPTTLAPTVQPASSGLPAGAYTLTLSFATISSCQNGICTSVTLQCGPAHTSSASIPVTVNREGNHATVAPVATSDSLRLTLQVEGSSVSGTISGTATGAASTTVTAAGTLAGTISPIQGLSAQGLLDGNLSLVGAGGVSCSGTTNNWALSSR
jgi:hypothetical protein